MIDRDARLSAVAAIAKPHDDASFLALLEQTYAKMSIGTGLDFAQVGRYWRGEAELPRPWRQAIARSACLDSSSGHFPYLYPSQTLAWTLAELPPERWLARGERTVVLLAPFIVAGNISSWLLPSDALRHARSGSHPEVQALRLSFESWAKGLAEGRDGWDGVRDWLRAAGADPASLAAALAEPDRHWHAGRMQALSELYVMLLLAREQLQRDAVPDDIWIDLLSCVRKAMADSHGSYLEVRQQYVLPLLRVLAASPRLKELLYDPGDGSFSWPVRELFSNLGLAFLLAEPLDAFRRLLDGAPSLRSFDAPEGFGERFPEAALLLEQLKLERCGELDPGLETPEALAWYRQILGRLPRDRSFESCLRIIAKHSTEAELNALVRAHLMTEDHRHLPYDLLHGMVHVGHLTDYLESANSTLRDRAAYRLLELATVRVGTGNQDDDDEDAGACERHPENWAVLMEAGKRHPELFIEETLSADKLVAGRDSLERWALLWQDATSSAKHRKTIVSAFFDALCMEGCPHAELLAFGERMLADDGFPFELYMEDAYTSEFERIVPALAKSETPLLALVPEMAARYMMEPTFSMTGRYAAPLPAAPVCRALAAFPERYEALEEKGKIKLLPLFDSAALAACGASLAKVFAGTSKGLRDPAVALVARCSPESIERSGLLDAPPKAKKLVLTGMGLSPDPAMGPLIAKHFKDKAHDDYTRDLALDALERAGHPLEGLDPWAGMDLAALQAEAAAQKIPAAIDKLWNDELATLLAPLGEALGRYLLAILSEAGDVLPRRARQILSFLPAGRRSDFALLGVNQWIAENGTDKLAWLLLALPEYGDERIANALVKATQDWKKTRKPKASEAIRLMCRLPGNFGVAQARELWESGKFSESITHNAKMALTEAAERQSMSLEEFLEQLVPDFGLTAEGLVLNVGPYAYTVRIRPDLSLVVIDAKGKAGKSLPKAKADEDPDKRSVAENQFKALSKNLKPVLKQQGKRLTRALQVGNAWPAPMWRRLFAGHPIMAVIAQGVVWSAEDAEGRPLKRFRPTESGELIGLDDAVYALPDDARVHVTHPLELDESERADWVTHFSDYALTSPIGQWETPVHAPTAEELAADELNRAAGIVLKRGRFGSLVEKWGYIKGGAGDGAQVNEHTWMLDGGKWLVTLEHEGINVFFDPDEEVTVDRFVAARRGPQGFATQRLGDLPPAFLNTLLAQAESLRSAAES
ncbi:DUF4132 domain-containing protein [Pseudomonas indica]|uniref:DUF4132 domain-containing protein n=1 Tax=Pseudomonas indica TaxID=137658 RepID=UPI000BABE623|nr:DUF4132 domain-containing protein [Pseudomonas indica]PAU51822.1 hypothetical protein BZL42_25080 [Pseudomonas indica]